MPRIRRNFIGGLVENDPLSDTDLVLTSEGLAQLPEVSDGDYIPIILDPDGRFGVPEIAYIISHDMFSTNATLASDNAATPVREGKEGTVAREHTQDTVWIHAPTAVDFDMINSIDAPKPEPDIEDEEWDSDVIDSAKWTVTEGVPGTVSLTATDADQGIYDLSTKPGTLLVQVNNNAVSLTQAFDGLGNERSIIACVSLTALADSTTAWADNDANLLFGLSDSTTLLETATNYVYLEIDTDTDRFNLSMNGSDIGVIGETPEESGLKLGGERAYLRFTTSLDGGMIYGYYSGNGEMWVPLGEYPSIVTLDNIWLKFVSSNPLGRPVPIHACYWVRTGNNKLLPW